MKKQPARQNDSGENEADDADRSSEQTREEEATDGQSAARDGPIGNGRKAGQSGSARASTVGGNPSEQSGGTHSAGREYVNYERTPDQRALSDRYGMTVREEETGKLQRLEREFGHEQVSRWAEEGMTVGTMGKPRDMAAFRDRQAERPADVPTDVERRNEASRQRNAGQNREGQPAGDVEAPDEVRRVVSSPGRSLDGTVQREMEAKMGGEFGDVQVHAGPQAAAAAEAIDARAFTVGNHVAFNQGEYRPETDEGKRVLAHELTHVRQQTEGAVSLLPKRDADRPVAEIAAGVSVHVQPKLKVSSPDDPAEREAEQVAERVVEMDARPDRASGEEDDEEAAEGVERSPDSARRVADVASRSAATREMSEKAEETVRRGVRGGGKPLPAETRSTFESKMGADFSNVRVHTGSEADEAARSIDAKAFTVGSDIAFGDGNYAPGSSSGNKLLAHELAHVVQQGGANTPVSRAPIVQRQGDGSDASDSKTQELVKKFKSNVDKAKKAWKVTLGTMHAAQMTMEMGSDGYKKISNMIDKCSAGLEDFKKISNKVDWIDKGAKAIELVTNVVKLGNIDIRKQPKKAAKRFEKICGAAGSLMSASKFPGISAFGKFLGKIESEQFFTHFVNLRKLAEDRYGSIGATTSGKKDIAEKLDQWFEHRDMPPKHKELSDATLKKIKDGAKTAAIDAAKNGSVKQALLLFRGYASAYAKWMGGLESWYKAVKKKEKKLKSKLEAYRGSSSLGGENEKTAKNAWNAFVEYEKQIEEEVLQFDYTDALGEVFRNNYYSATGEYPPSGEKLD